VGKIPLYPPFGKGEVTPSFATFRRFAGRLGKERTRYGCAPSWDAPPVKEGRSSTLLSPIPSRERKTVVKGIHREGRGGSVGG